MSFLSVFKSIFHAAESAAKIAAPIVAAVNPTVGALLTQATNAAVGAEALITAVKAGQQRADLVRAQTQATVDVINAILAAEGKPPLPVNITDVVQQQVQVVVGGLNTVATTVSSGAAAAASA